MTRLGLTAAVLAAGALLCSSSANASMITIKAGDPSPVTLATGTAPGTVDYDGAIGSWASITGSAVALIGSPGTATFQSDNIDFTTTGPTTLFVWVTLDGLTAPATGAIKTHSGLTSNDLSSGISSVTLWTYLDPTNGVAPPVGAQTLGTASFTAPGTADMNALGHTGSGPYSLQEVYEIVAARSGNANLTIDLTTTATPEPATLGLLGTGLLAGLGFLRRRRG